MKKKKSLNILKYVVLPGLLILVILGAFNYFVYKREYSFFYNIYNNEIIEAKSLVTRRFQAALIAAESARALFISSENVTKKEFDLFGGILAENLATGNIAVPAMIEWADPHNIVRYVYPLNKDSSGIVDLDLNKYPNRLDPILKAIQTKLPVVSEPIMFVEGYPGLLVYSPIFKGEEYLGQIIVAIRLEDLLAPSVGSIPIYHKDTNIFTGNFIIPFDDDVVLSPSGDRLTDAEGSLGKFALASEYVPEQSGVVRQNISLADKTWQLRFSPAYIVAVNKRMSYYAGASLIFAILIIIFLLILQKRREQLLKVMARTDALIVSIGDGLVACDKKGIITFANKKAEELSEYSAKESVGKSYYSVWRLVNNKGEEIPLKDRPFYLALTKKEVTQVTTGSHLYILNKTGSRVPLSSTIAPIIVEGNVEGAIAVFRDITKESEIDRLKTELLSLATHQLLTPATAIKWTAELLLNGSFGKLNKKQADGIQNIQSSNENEISLVSSLLNVSRIESGRIMINPKPSNLSDLAGEVAKELESKIKEKKHSFTIKAEEGLPKIKVDPQLIKQVYKNLLTNAIKYTPAKGKIFVEIYKTKNDLVSKISDNGYGIPAEETSKVFGKFYRGKNIVEIEKDGNGLGLYLVKQIVEVSGGKIGFESEINKGTTFWFSLPLAGSVAKAGEVTIT